MSSLPAAMDLPTSPPPAAGDALKIAETTLLAPAELSIEKVQRQLSAVCSGLDWADIYIQKRVLQSWHLEDGAVKTGSFSDDSGIGLRALQGETTAFASSDIIAAATVGEIAAAAKTAKTYGGTLKIGQLSPPPAPTPMFPAASPITTADDEEKIALLQKIDRLARAADSRVENVFASIVAAHEVVLIVRADGITAADIRPMVRLNVSAIICDGNRRESGGSGGGGRSDLSVFDDAHIRHYVEEAVSEAALKLDAQAAPAGAMPVVLGPGWAGIILHEAVGHGLEGDFNRKRQSAFSGRIGEQVAAKGITVMDAGNIVGRRGSLSCDDEGTPVSATTLIEDGVLRGYMQDIANARLMNTSTTGNGRRESYAHPPMPRMTNTFMHGGDKSPDDIIASVQRGLYAESFSGGEVDITNGNFVFVASRARLIEKGKLGATVKGATIIGNGPAIMPLVSMVGNDFSLDSGIGTCGKNGQWVPVGVGQPTIKVDSLNVGGEKSR